MRKNLFKMLGICLALAMVLTPQMAFGATVVWDGSTDADWNDATNWVGGAVPTSNVDDISINADGTNPTNNDVPAGPYILTGIEYLVTAPSMTITGNDLSLSAGSSVLNSSANTQTMNLNLTLVGAETFNANVGGLVFGGTVTHAAATALTVTGGFDTTISGIISGGGSLVKTGAGTLTLSADNTYTGVTTLTTGTINLGGDLASAALTTIGTGTTLNLTKSVANGGATTHTTTGKLDVNGYTYTSTGVYTVVNTSQLALDVSSSTASGSVDATAAGSTLVAGLAVDVNVTGAVADGSTYSIIKSNGVETGGQTVTDNSAVLSFTSTSVGNNIVLTASRSGTTYEDLASGGNASAAGSALETNLADNPTGDMLDVLNIIDVLSASEIETAMDTVSPDISAGAMDGSLEALNQSLGTVTAHLSSARSGNTGVSTGDGIEGFEEKDIWIKGFGNFSDQGTRSGIQGYESYTYGTTLGFDVLAAENVTLGISGGYAYTEVDPKKATLNNTDIDSYQGTLYGSFDGGPYYIDTVFAFAWNGYEGSRKIDLGDTSRTAKSDYDGQQYSGYVGGGYTFEEEGFEITPIASLQYTRLHIGDYTETGAGSLNLKISDQDYDVLESGLGLKIAYPIKEKSMTIIPEIHSSWYYDFIGDKAQTTSKFTGGGASFETNGADPAQHSFDVGAQLTLLTQKNISLILNYDLELKEDFSAHSGAVTVKYDF